MRTEWGARFYLLGNRGEKQKRTAPATCDIHVSSTAFGNLDWLPLGQIEQPNQCPRQARLDQLPCLIFPFLRTDQPKHERNAGTNTPQRVAPTPESRQRDYRGHPTSISIVRNYLCMIIRPLRMLGKMAAAAFYHLIL